MSVAVITPTYNEAGSIGALIARVFALHPEAHMLVADVRLGTRVAEIPIVYRNRRTGASKFSGRIAWEGGVAPWRFAAVARRRARS